MAGTCRAQQPVTWKCDVYRIFAFLFAAITDIPPQTAALQNAAAPSPPWLLVMRHGEHCKRALGVRVPKVRAPPGRPYAA